QQVADPWSSAALITAARDSSGGGAHFSTVPFSSGQFPAEPPAALNDALAAIYAGRRAAVLDADDDQPKQAASRPAPHFTHLWMDVLCIPQDSDAHKAAEVAMMGDYYSRAACVWVFLDVLGKPALPPETAGRGRRGIGSRGCGRCRVRAAEQALVPCARWSENAGRRDGHRDDALGDDVEWVDGSTARERRIGDRQRPTPGRSVGVPHPPHRALVNTRVVNACRENAPRKSSVPRRPAAPAPHRASRPSARPCSSPAFTSVDTPSTAFTASWALCRGIARTSSTRTR
ncbi:hypothetical protein DFJ73DRAFT_832164, partial [Zopfochytrium polystomum]